MKQIKHCTFQIQISQEYKLKCFVNEEEQEEYIIPNILFDMNEILINQQNDKTINFRVYLFFISSFFNYPLIIF